MSLFTCSRTRRVIGSTLRFLAGGHRSSVAHRYMGNVLDTVIRANAYPQHTLYLTH